MSETSQTPVESLINNSVIKIHDIRSEMLKEKDMLDSFFDQNTELQEVEKQIKQLQKKRLNIKNGILKQSEPARLSDKVKESKRQLKEIKIALSDYLIQYSKTFETNQIELNDGVVRQIIFNSKLVNLK